MEYEVRYYYSKEELGDLINKLSSYRELGQGLRTYEKTIQYNHSDDRYNFYSKDIDGRFRVRISSNDMDTKCMLSWKRRLSDTIETDINKELEKEVRINSEDIDNFIYIIENVMRFILVESYERYRNVFINQDVEISIDEYPFGIALEIENKSKDKNPYDVIKYWLDKLELRIEDSYRLSWDDKYLELCKEQGKIVYNEVTFDKDMPVVKNK